MQYDADDTKRVVVYSSRQLEPANCNYTVHEIECLAIKYALAKLRIYRLGDRHFNVHLDYASLHNHRASSIPNRLRNSLVA